MSDTVVTPLSKAGANALMGAFRWAHTREGCSYWGKVHNRLDGIHATELVEPQDNPPDVSQLAFDLDKLDKLIDAVAVGFLWSGTPEGIAYWQDVTYRLCALHDIATDKSAPAPSPFPSAPPSTEFLQAVGALIDATSHKATVANFKTAGYSYFTTGHYSCVYDVPDHDDLVLKISRSEGSWSDGWPLFARAVMRFGGDNPFLPRIYSFTEYMSGTDKDECFFVALMERLEPGGYLDAQRMAALNYLYYGNSSSPHFTPDLIKALDLIKTHVNGYRYDLHDANVMNRNGHMVITDPVSWFGTTEDY